MRTTVGWPLTLSQTLIFCSSIIASLDDFCLFLSPGKLFDFLSLYQGKPILFYLLHVTIDKTQSRDQQSMVELGCWTVERHLAYTSLQPRLQLRAAQGRCCGECGEGGTGFQGRRGDHFWLSPCLLSEAILSKFLYTGLLPHSSLEAKPFRRKYSTSVCYVSYISDIFCFLAVTGLFCSWAILIFPEQRHQPIKWGKLSVVTS